MTKQRVFRLRKIKIYQPDGNRPSGLSFAELMQELGVRG